MSNIRAFPAPARVLPTEQPFRIRWGSDLVDSRPVSWLVEDMIPRGTVSLLAGEPFLGKTWICQSLMIAHGLGVPWYGRDVGRGRAYALFAEDIDERVLIPRRDTILAMYGADRHAFCDELSWTAPTVEHPDFDPLLFETQRFKPGGTPTELWRQLTTHCEELGTDLIVIDNATTCLDSVDPDHVKAFLRMLMQMAVERDAAVVLLHHPPKDGSAPYAGTALWARLCRNILVLQRSTKAEEDQDDDGRRVLRTYQSNWTGARPKIWLRWQDGCLVEDEAPEPVRAARSPTQQRSYPMSQTERQDFRYRVLIAMKTIVERGGTIYADMAHRNSMPARARRQAGWQLYSAEQIDDAVDELVKVGQAERVTVGLSVIVRPAS